MIKSLYSNPLFIAVVSLASFFFYGSWARQAQSQQPTSAVAHAPSEQDLKLEQAWQKASSK